MSDIQFEIEGEGAIAATEELLQLPGLEGNWTPASEEPTKDGGVLATIATVIGITVGSITVAEKIYAWYQKLRKKPEAKIEKVILVGRNGRRIMLSKASVEQIRQFLDS